MFPVEVVHESNPSTRYRSLSLESFCESVVCLQQQCCTICSCGTRYCNLVKDFFIGFVMYAIVDGSGPTVSIPVLCNSVDEASWKTLQSQLSHHECHHLFILLCVPLQQVYGSLQMSLLCSGSSELFHFCLPTSAIMPPCTEVVQHFKRSFQDNARFVMCQPCSFHHVVFMPRWHPGALNNMNQYGANRRGNTGASFLSILTVSINRNPQQCLNICLYICICICSKR